MSTKTQIEWSKLGGIPLEVLDENEQRQIVRELSNAWTELVCDLDSIDRGTCLKCGETLIVISKIYDNGLRIVKYCRKCKIKYIFDSVKCWRRGK